jgi:hypothetical protein
VERLHRLPIEQDVPLSLVDPLATPSETPLNAKEALGRTSFFLVRITRQVICVVLFDVTDSVKLYVHPDVWKLVASRRVVRMCGAQNV